MLCNGLRVLDCNTWLKDFTAHVHLCVYTVQLVGACVSVGVRKKWSGCCQISASVLML